MTNLVNGNALYLPLKDKSVQCVVTSPPYWGLRDYGTGKWIGGDTECGHTEKHISWSTPIERNQKKRAGEMMPYKNTCAKCGAIRIDKQLGLEQTPEEYVENLVNVFREAWRVLRDDGTLWLNLGDSYASGKGTCYNPGGGESSLGKERKDAGVYPLDRGNISELKKSGLKPKDLVGIPWRVAFALQADGWYLRNDIIWHKPNPMPESVKDRCTKSHEYIFLLTKNKKYYYDNEAVKEDSVKPLGIPKTQGVQKKQIELGRSVGTLGSGYSEVGRNKRTVWTVTTKPYTGAHYATFPPDLIDDCIKAGSAEGDIVLDPFVGSGTTCMVARDLGRNSIGLDLSLDYLINDAKKRLEIDKLEYWLEGGPEVESDLSGLPMFDNDDIENQRDHKNLRTPGQQPHSMHLARINKETNQE